MIDDEYEKLRLKSELEKLKQDRESQKQSTWIAWFLAIWILPLLGMLLAQGDDLPKTAGPSRPVVGPMSIWGYCFVGVPIAAFLYCRFAGDR